eukprot:7816916-Heterocapsa_arctica.AAC.1
MRKFFACRQTTESTQKFLVTFNLLYGEAREEGLVLSETGRSFLFMEKLGLDIDQQTKVLANVAADLSRRVEIETIAKRLFPF